MGSAGAGGEWVAMDIEGGTVWGLLSWLPPALG